MHTGKYHVVRTNESGPMLALVRDAAPDLLAALRLAEKSLVDMTSLAEGAFDDDGTADDAVTDVRLARDALGAVRAAIAKAEGR